MNSGHALGSPPTELSDEAADRAANEERRTNDPRRFAAADSIAPFKLPRRVSLGFGAADDGGPASDLAFVGVNGDDGDAGTDPTRGGDGDGSRDGERPAPDGDGERAKPPSLAEPLPGVPPPPPPASRWAGSNGGVRWFTA